MKRVSYACAFVNEWERLAIVHPLEAGSGVTAGLLLDRGDVLAPMLRLGFDHANGFVADEENVVGRTDIGLVFTNGDTGAGTEVDLLLVLNQPACLLQHQVDLVARSLFGRLVEVRHPVHRPFDFRPEFARVASGNNVWCSSL